MLALAGCGGDGNGGQDEEDSPLTEYLGYGLATEQRRSGGQGEVSEADRQRHYEAEEFVAECMAEEGFDYTPVSLDDQMTGAFHEAYELDPEDFADQYGYGAATLARGEDQPEPPPDPNQEIREELSAAAQEAYQRAMWGDMSELEPDEDGAVEYSPEDLDPEDQGCRTRAQLEVYGDRSGENGFEQFEGLFQDLGQLYQRIEEEPRLADAHREWASCMADAGFDDLGTPQEAQESVFERMNEAYGQGAPPLQEGEGDARGSASTSEEGATATPGVTQPDEEALAEVRDYELAVAPADYACQQEHVADVRSEVARELEEEFVEQHRDALEAYRDWQAEQSDQSDQDDQDDG